MSTGSGCTPSGAFPSQAGPSPKLRTSGGGFGEGNGAPRSPRTSGGRSCANAADAHPPITRSVNAAVFKAVWTLLIDFPFHVFLDGNSGCDGISALRRRPLFGIV